MDGELTFLDIDDPSSTEAQLRQNIVATMESNKRRIYEEMRDSQSPLTTHEMKSLSADSVEVMKAVTRLGDFSWTYCLQRPHCNIAKYKRGRDMVAKVVTGRDAVDPPWDIPVCLYTLHPALCSSHYL